MTTEIAATLGILLLAVVLFITEKLRVDLIALIILALLAVSGLVTPAEALSGFSSPAVITVWAVFILSGALARTGLATTVGRHVLRISGDGTIRLMVVIMITAGVLSAFMNNIGVAAMMLPVVITISRSTHIPASKLLIPLAFGCLLGGMITLIGTPPNILASDILREYGLEPFSFFDFAPMGLTIMIGGILYMAIIGRRLLPERHPVQSLTSPYNGKVDPEDYFLLEERLALVQIPQGSPLAGLTIVESRIGRALGITILGMERQGRKRIVVERDMILAEEDRLLVVGKLDRLEKLSMRPYLFIEEEGLALERLFSLEMSVAELQVGDESPLTGRTILEINMRRQYNVNVLAIRRENKPLFLNLQTIPLQAGDCLLVHGYTQWADPTHADFNGENGFTLCSELPGSVETYGLTGRLMAARIPGSSPLVGHPLRDSNLADSFGMVVLGLKRGEEPVFLPDGDTILQGGDMLWVKGDPEQLEIARGLQDLIIRTDFDHEQVELETPRVALVEMVLSPYTSLVDKTLREIHFRDKYGLSVLAIWRNGESYRTDLGKMALRFGDSFLLYGEREKINMLSQENDFIVLSGSVKETPLRSKAPLAALIMAGVVISVIAGWLTISVAAIAGVVLMILSGCLKMDEAYRAIDWRAVFLIACMLPLGIAMEKSGAALFIADSMVNLVGGLGPHALLAGLFILTSIASQFMPNPVVTVLLAPIAINTAVDLNLSPHALMMVVAIAASASFMSPVGHPANVLVMGPGGYRFSDYLKVGLPLILVVLILTLLVLPVFWPLQ